MEFISQRRFTKQHKQFLQANDETLDLPLNTEIIKQAHGLMIEDEKGVLVREYRKSPAFAGYHIFAPAGYIERYMEDAVFRFR